MNIAVIGTGMVGQTIASKLKALGHELSMGTRDVNETLKRTNKNQMTGQSFADWKNANPEIGLYNYADLKTNDVFVNATSGGASIEALNAVGKEKMQGKIILDIANPLDFSNGMPPSLSICNTDSLAEHIQKAFPESHVVKSLNTMNCFIMMNPSIVPGEHNVFLSGNDNDAKKKISSLLKEIGWTASMIIDLGDITTARGTEMLLPIWLRLWGVVGNPNFNFHIAKK